MYWNKAGIAIASSGLDTQLIGYGQSASQENATEWQQREARNALIAQLREAIEAIRSNAPTSAATVAAGAADTLGAVESDPAPARTQYRQLADLTKVVKGLLEELAPTAPVIPARQ